MSKLEMNKLIVLCHILILLLEIICYANGLEIKTCPSCHEIKSRPMITEVEKTCFNYVCRNFRIPSIKDRVKSKPNNRSQVFHKLRDQKEDYTVYDERVEKLTRNKILKTAYNLQVNGKRDFGSRVYKIPQTSFQPFQFDSEINKTNADVNVIKQTFDYLFSKQRNYFYDLNYKNFVRNAAIKQFQSYGLQTQVQKFRSPADVPGVVIDAENLIAILPSKRFGQEADKVFLVGGHYDTVRECPGVDDNGSGSVSVLEVARLLSSRADKLDSTIYFVLFDQEETGLHGSVAFVKEYLIPNVIQKQKAVYSGAYVIDMLLLFDGNENVQTLPRDVKRMSPDANNWINRNSRRGDFAAVWCRDADLFLFKTLAGVWNSQRQDDFKILLVHAPLPSNYYKVNPNDRYSTFYRSDHASFWSSARFNSRVETLPAVLLTDMGPWRGYQRKCYHQPCDNNVQLTATNLQFIARIIDAVSGSVVKLLKI